MNPVEISTPMAALLAGMVTSLHCVGMCGPLACSRQAGAGSGATGTGRFALGYHLGRLFSYSCLGALAGLFGKSITPWTEGSLVRWLPWAFILTFILMIFGLDKKVRLPAAWSGWLGRGFLWSRRHHGGSGFFLGMGTPLLPCGPLYLVLASMMLSGSAIHGAILMGAFTLGTAGLLVLLQLNLGWVSGRLSPGQLFWLRRGLALSAVLMMVWRVSQDVHPFQSNVSCPLCP